jgi:tRNA threonylcarbamoyl adenosine modification protein YeaZ
MQLAIDTSTETAGIALLEAGEVAAELTWHSGQNHTTELLPNLRALLKSDDLSVIEAVFVAMGPGSFNGLRVGVSTAKGLAYSLEVPLVGINTLEADAYQHAGAGLPVCPVQNAGRGELAVARYRLSGREWIQLEAAHVTNTETLCEKTGEKTLFCGEYLPNVATVINERLEELAVIVTPATRLRRAAFLAELGLKRLAAGETDDPATLQPVYLRRPPITQPKTPAYRISPNNREKRP